MNESKEQKRKMLSCVERTMISRLKVMVDAGRGEDCIRVKWPRWEAFVAGRKGMLWSPQREFRPQASRWTVGCPTFVDVQRTDWAMNLLECITLLCSVPIIWVWGFKSTGKVFPPVYHASWKEKSIRREEQTSVAVELNGCSYCWEGQIRTRQCWVYFLCYHSTPVQPQGVYRSESIIWVNSQSTLCFSVWWTCLERCESDPSRHQSLFYGRGGVLLCNEGCATRVLCSTVRSGSLWYN